MKAYLHYLQAELGLTHRQLAVLMGTTRSTVTRYLSGIRSLPAPAEARLALLYATAMQCASQKLSDSVEAQWMEAPLGVDSAAIAKELESARIMKRRLEQMHTSLIASSTQAQKLAQWLEAIEPNESLPSSPKTKRCFNELRQQCKDQLTHCRFQLKELALLLGHANRDIKWWEHCLQQASLPDFPENIPNST